MREKNNRKKLCKRHAQQNVNKDVLKVEISVDLISLYFLARPMSTFIVQNLL